MTDTSIHPAPAPTAAITAHYLAAVRGRRIRFRHEHVDALLVDPLVLHTGDELHVRHAQLGAVDPARGGAQPRARR